jgi:hypothetical protein
MAVNASTQKVAMAISIHVFLIVSSPFCEGGPQGGQSLTADRNFVATPTVRRSRVNSDVSETRPRDE